MFCIFSIKSMFKKMFLTFEIRAKCFPTHLHVAVEKSKILTLISCCMQTRATFNAKLELA